MVSPPAIKCHITNNQDPGGPAAVGDPGSGATDDGSDGVEAAGHGNPNAGYLGAGFDLRRLRMFVGLHCMSLRPPSCYCCNVCHLCCRLPTCQQFVL